MKSEIDVIMDCNLSDFNLNHPNSSKRQGSL